MKKRLPLLLMSIAIFLFVTACNTATPENYFDQAVLNTNMLVGFAGEGQIRELESPSVQMDEKTKQAVPMKRAEVIESKLKFIEQSFDKIKGLKQTDETRDMLATSISLYEYIIPVYKSEYTNLAKMYDDGVAKEQIQANAKALHDKHFTQFEERYNKLIGLGKNYAAKHNIPVHWNDNK